MKIVVVSDTHGNNKEVIEKISEMERPDLLFHLGDYIEDGIKICTALGIDTIMVKGNGDRGNRIYNEDELIEISGKKIFLTHGHRYDVRYGITNLYYKALELNVDMVLFGHTHVPINIEENGIIFMNPGSPSIPRTQSKAKTIGLIDINDKIYTKIIEIK